jgi:serine phosphatase RsbU (regulator of sigma subunit)
MIKLPNIKNFLISFILVLAFALQGFSQTFKSPEENNAKAEQFLSQGNKAEAARLYTQTAFYYRNEGQLEKAIEFYLKVLELNKELNNRVGQMLTHSNLSMLYIEAEQYANSLEHLNKELEFRERNKKLQEILPVLLTIASVEVELRQFESAEETVNRSIDLAKEINDLKMLKRAYGVALDVYKKWGKQAQFEEYMGMYSAIDKKIKEDMMASVQNEAQQQVSAAYSEKAKTEEELKVTSKELEKTVVTLQETERIKSEQEMELSLQQAQINEQNALLHLERVRKRFWAIGFAVAIVFVLALVFLLLKIRSANKKIEAQHKRLEKQNKEIKSSIYYAETIQQAMLSDMSELNSFGDSFMIFRPKDIVSGDFYWSAKVSENRAFLAVVDCTGHGVPGAFMSMIGIRILSEIVQELKVESPANVLEHLNDMVRDALKQEQTDNNDGMDLAIVRLDKQSDGSTMVTFSGAKRPVYIGRKSNIDLEVLKPDRKSIGGHQPTKRFIEFNDQTIKLEKGDEMFLFSDGIVDQNDPYRKKFGRARLENILKSFVDEDVSKQKEILEEKLNLFIQDEEQRDDITLTGFKIK